MESIINFLKPEVFFHNIFVTIAIRIVILMTILKGLHLLLEFAGKKVFENVDNRKQAKQIHTIISTVKSVVDFFVVALCIMEILPKLGIDIRPILTAAGVVGVAVGFGSKQLIEDVLSGAMLILQGQILVGDIVEIDGKIGIVEKLNLKMVVLRDWDGKVYYIRNGMINVVTNYTRDYAFSIVEVGVAYKENIDNVIKTVVEVGNNELRNGVCKDYVLSDTEAWGLDSFGDSAINLKFRVKVKTMYQWKVRREFNRLIKNKFDELGIEIPFPQRTLHIEKEDCFPMN